MCFLFRFLLFAYCSLPCPGKGVVWCVSCSYGVVKDTFTYIYAVTFFWVLMDVVLIYCSSVFAMAIYWPPFLDPLFPGQMCNRCMGWVTRVPLLVKTKNHRRYQSIWSHHLEALLRPYRCRLVGLFRWRCTPLASAALRKSSVWG